MNRYLSNYSGIEVKCSSFLDDCVSSVCMLVVEGENIRFTHRSFQEFFAANYISLLDDDKQRKILTDWVKETPQNIDSNKTFINSLISMQFNRSAKNLFTPILEMVEENLNGISREKFEYIHELFESFSVIRTRRSEYKIGFKLRKKYLPFFTLHFSIISSLGSDIKDIDIINKENENLIIDYIKNKDERKIYIDEGEVLDEVKLFLIAFTNSWFSCRLDFLLRWKSDFNAQLKTRKRNFKSIIDEL